MAEEWTPAFPGQRPPLEKGNQVSVRHGAYSSALDKHPRVLALAAEAREAAPWLEPADEHALRLWAMAVVRLELLAHVLLPPLSEDPAALEEWARKVESSPTTSRDARGWHANAMRLGDQLGLTPAGRQALQEHAQTLILVADAQALFDALFAAVAPRVPVAERPALLAAVDEAIASLGLPLSPTSEHPDVEGGAAGGA